MQTTIDEQDDSSTGLGVFRDLGVPIMNAAMQPTRTAALQVATTSVAKSPPTTERVRVRWDMKAKAIPANAPTRAASEAV